MSRGRRLWRVIRAVWVTAGLLLTAFIVLSYRAWGVDDSVLRSAGGIQVTETDSSISFTPDDAGARAGLLFLPGGMVDPHAYAPLLRRIAAAGHPAILVRLPHLGGRHALGKEGRSQAVGRALTTLRAHRERPWIVSGHSLGGAIAARVAREEPEEVAGLVLLATTHPRDFSLAEFDPPVVKVYGTRDGIAPLARMKENESNLPRSTRWVAIEGGNHSQFGHYGFQLLDGRARISRAQQQDQVASILIRVLDRAGNNSGSP